MLQSSPFYIVCGDPGYASEMERVAFLTKREYSSCKAIFSCTCLLQQAFVGVLLIIRGTKLAKHPNFKELGSDSSDWATARMTLFDAFSEAFAL